MSVALPVSFSTAAQASDPPVVNQISWRPLGPAPSTQGLTNYTEDSSGRISALAAHPMDANTLYVAAAGGGVWKTIDGGNTWVPLTDSQSTLFMGAIALAPSNPEVIYAGTGEAHMGPSKARNFRDNIYYGRGILKSINGGSEWTLLGAAEFDRRTISRIVVDPADPNEVYVAVGALATNGRTGNTGIWKSTDGGVTWTNTTTTDIPTDGAFSDLVADRAQPQTLYAAVGQPGGDPRNGVYKSSDGGATWAPAGDFPVGDPRVGRITLAVAPTAPQRLFAAIARSGPTNSLFQLLRTRDAGSTWQVVMTVDDKFCPSGTIDVNYLASAGDYHNTLAVDPVNPDIIYAGGICLISSAGGGDPGTWVTIAPGETEGPHRDHQTLAFDASGRLLDATDGGLWRLDDAALPPRWANLNTDLHITQFVGIALHPTNPNLAYGGTQDTGTVRFEGTARWPRLLRGDGGATLVSSSSPDIVYQVTRISTAATSSRFRRSANGGNTWSTADVGIPRGECRTFYFPAVLDPADPNHLLLGTNRVYETFDGGATWNVIRPPDTLQCTVADHGNIDSIAMAPSDSKTIYISVQGHIFVTFDGGGVWNPRDVPTVADHFQKLVVDPTNNLIAYAVRDRFDGGHVFRTEDGGQSWTDRSGDLPNLPTYALVVDSRLGGNVLYAGNDDGVYVSSDLGGHWVRFGDGLPNAQVTHLELNTTLKILAAGTHGRGMWEISVD
jgi:photosystem II stability/assembly factor-like uncharacterized protein